MQTLIKKTTLVFDGAMSEARVYVNGKEACFWPFGYNSFHCDITELLHKEGKDNVLAVRLENRPQSSRWYPGAGLYRNVHLITAEKIHVPVWGTQITTPHVANDYASVCLRTSLLNVEKEEITIETEILAPNGEKSFFQEEQRTHQSRATVYTKLHCRKSAIVVARNTVPISGRL